MTSAPCSPTRSLRRCSPPVGRPAEAPWRLALVTVLQFAESLSDRLAAEAARGRIDWKYLMGLDLTDPASTPRCSASSALASWPAMPRRSCSTRF